MTKYYYVMSHSGETCGHCHSDLQGKTLRRCAAAFRRVAPEGWTPDLWTVDDTGTHARAPRALRDALARELPSRGPGTWERTTPRIEQASPLYRRLSVPERQRYQALASAAGIPDLGEYALALFEREAAKADA
jgi:hypothetical protein